ncbi:MAG TPA: hypothetical protein VGH87_29575, partial [Polyangiaceae bacterium]
MINNLRPIVDVANFVFAFAVLLSAAYAYQRSRRAALFVALGGVVAIMCVLFEIFLAYARFRFFSSPEIVFYLFQLESIVRHVALF